MGNFRPSSRPALAPESNERLGSVWTMAKQPIQQSSDLDGERVRRLRLRADGQRSLAVNLEETISLTRKLFELRDAAQRAR
jgi:2-polyprenyl-6-methoxyphenol hydroxylase-like FAD-dependent oxidoreductase